MKKPTQTRYVKAAVKWLTIPQHFFLLFGSFFGLIFVFLVPPMQAPDEQAHLYKAYQTSSFQIYPTPFMKDGKKVFGTSLPVSLLNASEELRSPIAGNPAQKVNSDIFKKYLTMPLDQSKSALVESESSNVYSPIIYIPQAIGIGVGRVLNASPVMLIWLGRIANLIAWLAIMYVALRMFPVVKWGFVVLALNPVVISLASSLSGDAMSIALAFLFGSMIFALRFSKRRLQLGHMIAISGLALLLCLSKPTNVILLPMLFLLPKVSFARSAYKWVFCGVVVALGLLIGIAWNISNKELLDISVEIQRAGYDASPTRQLQYILQHPLHYAKVLIENYMLVIRGSADAVLSTYFGVFGWLDTSIPLWTQLLYFAGLVLAALYQIGRGLALGLLEKTWLLLLFIVMGIGSVTAMYINYTPVGATIVEGVQGRYFIPASILLLGLFTGKKKLLMNHDRQLVIAFIIILAVVFCMTAARLFIRYYR